MAKMNKLKTKLHNNNFQYITKSNEVHVEIDNKLITIFHEDKEFYLHVFDKQNVKSFILDDPQERYYTKKVKSVITVLNELTS